jgi:transcription-repair coupling factor (superfamily II helicase)
VITGSRGLRGCARLRTKPRRAGRDERDATSGDGAIAEEYLTLEFSGGAKLHVPVSKIDLVQKYIGAFTGKPELSTLGGKKWKKQKEQVREAVRDFAAELLRVQAAREALPGIRYPGRHHLAEGVRGGVPVRGDGGSARRDRRDQARHERPDRPMDRLICGDVGFGKTEVAMRAAFKAAEYGKQVAVLVPTTVLAEQHDRTFRERMADYPFRIESLSRFKTERSRRSCSRNCARGKIDIIIGTHRLLSRT